MKREEFKKDRTEYQFKRFVGIDAVDKANDFIKGVCFLDMKYQVSNGREYILITYLEE